MVELGIACLIWITYNLDWYACWAYMKNVVAP
jgi:hypothetical protein